MRWFKHFSDNHRGQTVQELLNKHGHSGVVAYYFIMELCSEKIEENDFVFTFKRPYFDNILRTKRKSTDNILRTLSESGVMKAEANQNEVRIEMPILLNLLSRDSKKARIKRVESAAKARLEEEEEIEEEIEEEKEIYISTEPKKSVAVVAQKSIGYNISSIKPELIKSWADTYPKEFLEMEYKKARSWLLSNPHKAPKKNFDRFLNAWFDRGWEQYRKTLKSEPIMMNAEDLAQTLNRGDEW